MHKMIKYITEFICIDYFISTPIKLKNLTNSRFSSPHNEKRDNVLKPSFLALIKEPYYFSSYHPISNILHYYVARVYLLGATAYSRLCKGNANTYHSPWGL